MGTLIVSTTITLKDGAGAQVTKLGGATIAKTFAGNYAVEEFTVPDSTTDMQLVLGTLASAGATYIGLISDQDVTIQVGATTGVDERLLSAGVPMFIELAAAETDLYVTNASGETATIMGVFC